MHSLHGFVIKKKIKNFEKKVLTHPVKSAILIIEIIKT